MIRDEWTKHTRLVSLGATAVALVAIMLTIPPVVTTPLAGEAASPSDLAISAWIAAGAFGTLAPVFGIVVGAIVFSREHQWHTYPNLALLYSPQRIIMGKLGYGTIVATSLSAIAVTLSLAATTILGIRGFTSRTPVEVLVTLSATFATTFIGFLFWFAISGCIAFLLRNTAIAIFVVLGGAYAESALGPAVFGEYYSASVTPLSVQLSSVENLRQFAGVLLTNGENSQTSNPLVWILLVAYVATSAVLALVIARYRAATS